VERRPILLRLHLKGNAALAFPTSNSSDALSARRTEVFSSLQELGWGSKQPEGIEGPLGSGALKGELISGADAMQDCGDECPTNAACGTKRQAQRSSCSESVVRSEAYPC
jgi:hypothetical protein